MYKANRLRDLLNREHLSLMFIGMSGVGKTTISNRFSKSEWFHYSIDYRIGTCYLNEPIIDSVKRHMVTHPTLRRLLQQDAISITGNISTDNLSLLSYYIGMVGNPDLGGTPWDTYIHRQREHLDAEISAVQDITRFQQKARDIYGYPHFIIDSSGSIAEMPYRALDQIADTTLIIYIKAPEALEETLVERAQRYPKPLYYDESFLRTQVAAYVAERPSIDHIDQADPHDFGSWIFPKLIADRLPKYQSIADRYGITIDYQDIAHLESSDAILKLCEQKIASL